MVEPYAGKLACTVLRGRSGGNPADLPDEIANRYEGIEPLSVWAERILRSGFYLKKEIAHLPPVNHPTLTVRQYKGYVGVEYHHCTIVGVLAAQMNK